MLYFNGKKYFVPFVNQSSVGADATPAQVIEGSKFVGANGVVETGTMPLVTSGIKGDIMNETHEEYLFRSDLKKPTAFNDSVNLEVPKTVFGNVPASMVPVGYTFSSEHGIKVDGQLPYYDRKYLEPDEVTSYGDGYVYSHVPMEKCIVESGVGTKIPLGAFGYVKSQHVLKNETFTSTAGYLATGTLEKYDGSQLEGLAAGSYENNVIVVTHFEDPNYVEGNSYVYSNVPLEEFGNATASDVLADKTFTSADGFKVQGTMPTVGVPPIEMKAEADEEEGDIAINASITVGKGYTEGGERDNAVYPKLTVAGDTATMSCKGVYISRKVTAGSASTPATPITANPSLSNTYTSGSGYKMSVSKTQSVTPSVVEGYVKSGTAGTITVSGEAYVPQSSTGSATSSTTATATVNIGYGQQTTIGAGYYHEARIIRNGVAGVDRATTSLTSAKSNNTLVFTAGNNQGTGYVTGSNSTATKTVSLSVSGKTVTASDGANSISTSVSDSYIIPSGTKTIASSGTHDVTQYASATVAAGKAQTPSDTITATNTITIDDNGLITATASGSKSITPTVTAGYVSSGTAGTVSVSGSGTKQLTKRTSADLTASGATVTAPAGYYPSGASTSVQTAGIGLPTFTVDAYDEDNEIGIKATTNQSVGYVSSEKQRTIETFAKLTVDGNKVTMECNGAKIERTVGASIATCSIKVKFTTNAGNILTSATTFANGAFSAFKSDTKSGEFTINNVVCGSALSIATSTMCSLYWSGTKTDHRSLYGGTITVPSSAGTYTVEVGVLDD